MIYKDAWRLVEEIRGAFKARGIELSGTWTLRPGMKKPTLPDPIKMESKSIPMDAVCDILGSHRRTVNSWLDEMGIDRARHHSISTYNRLKRHKEKLYYSIVARCMLITMLWDKGYAYREIGEVMNINKSNACRNSMRLKKEKQGNRIVDDIYRELSYR
mgnify:CR=1 FL=1